MQITPLTSATSIKSCHFKLSGQVCLPKLKLFYILYLAVKWSIEFRILYIRHSAFVTRLTDKVLLVHEFCYFYALLGTTGFRSACFCNAHTVTTYVYHMLQRILNSKRFRGKFTNN